MKLATALSSHVLLISAALLAGCTSPYHGKELRRAEVPVTIQAEYMAYACGDFFPQIEPVDPLPDNLDPSWLDGGLTFRLPPNLQGPDQVDELGVAGNQFELVGYYYYVVVDGRHYLHPRFDLYAWRPVLPYRVWRLDPAKGEGPALQDMVISYVDGSDGWRSLDQQPKDPLAYDFARRYDGCP